MGREENSEKEEEVVVLYETRGDGYGGVKKVFSLTVVVGICMIWFYRLKQIITMPSSAHHQAGGYWVLIGMFMAELWFGLYWIITQPVRWNFKSRHPFKDKLSHRYKEQVPDVDIFVCTADPIMEPPTLVINTVLSAMAYNYPPEKLSVYVSDDGGSELTFYALLEASSFSKIWIPFCRNNTSVQPRSPEAYFTHYSAPTHSHDQWFSVKKMYEEMKDRIESALRMRTVPKETRDRHKGFSEWDNRVTKEDHQSIVQIIIDGRDSNFVDNDGSQLPTLVYMAREKRPNFPHNFKAGAVNSLIRVSSEISNAPLILSLDCDMYTNNPDTIQEVLCFFMDENKGHEIAYVQLPQHYNNLSKNDIYGNSNVAVDEVELAGIGGYDAALYCGTGCFHRRLSLCGAKFQKDLKTRLDNNEGKGNDTRTVDELEEASKPLANCNYENNSQWGKEMGLIYGCPVEDIVTGLAIQCRGWKSIYYNPKERGFVGVAPTTLEVALVQFKRWSEGMFQIFASKYCPLIYGHGKIKLGARMGYCIYLLWAPMSFPMLYYATLPPLCLIHGISLFPQITSLWFLPFGYVLVAKNCYSIAEALSCRSTFKAWWNLQRMWFIRRTTSFLFAFIDTIKRQLGLSETKFNLTAKDVAAEDIAKRYEEEIMEFGSSTIMFIIMATLALLNLLSFISGTIRTLMNLQDYKALDRLILQVILSGVIVLINLPVYNALFIRHDKGRMPSSVLLMSVVLVSLACLMPIV